MNAMTAKERSDNSSEIRSFPKHAVRPANRMSDHTKTTFKSESSFGNLGIHRSAVGIKTHRIPTVSRRGRKLDSGKLRGHAGVQRRPFYKGQLETKNCIVYPLSHTLGSEHHQCVQLRKSVYGLTDAPRAWWDRLEKDMTSQGWRNFTIGFLG